MEEIKVTEQEKAIQERNIEMAKILIIFYNHRTLCEISANTKKNQNLVIKALNRVNGDIATVKEHVKEWLENNTIDDYDSDEEMFEACFAEFTPMSTKRGADMGVALGLDIISKAVIDTIKETSIGKIETDIMAGVQGAVDKYIQDTYGPIEHRITVNVDGVKNPVKGVLHKQFDKVLKIVSKGFGAYLVGPAGSGKNVLCKQVAEAMGLKFYFTNAVTQEYKITGFTDAMGNYQPTQFYKAFTEGGVFMLDEIDASIPEVLNILNAALANRYFDFPAPIGFKEAHPDFHVIAAGNTSGHGADYQYVGRNQLDGAGLDRFKYVPVDYCDEVENNIAGDINLANFCREFRAASKKVGVNIIVSYRAIEGLAALLPIMTMREALECCLVKDLEKDDLRMITRELSSTPYKTVLNEICEQM